MSGISFTGLGSGMPVTDIVDAFVNAEKVPFQQRLNKQGAKLTTNISANGALKSALASLASSLEKLTSANNFQLRKASGSDDFIKVESEKTAQVGSYDVKVNNLAQADKTMTNAFVDTLAVGEGKLTFATAKDIAASTTAFSIDVSATDTLSDIRDKINAATDNDDITATIVTEDSGEQRLVMTANNTGLDNAVTITATQADGTTPLDPASRLNDLDSANLTSLKPALDASITIDGAITLTNATNTFENPIDGVTLTAQKAHGVDDGVSNASVSEDNALVDSELAAFVTSYNEYYDLIKTLGKADGSGESGAMVGDSMLRGVSSKLRNMLSRSFDSNDGNTLSLSQLGVESDQYGKLSLDSTKLKQALGDDPGAVQQFFVGTEAVPGFAASVDAMIKNYTNTGGLIDSRIEGYQTQLDKLDDDMLAFDRKMEKYEARLLAQYNAMDMLVTGMTSTSTYLMGQLDNMPGVVKSSK